MLSTTSIDSYKSPLEFRKRNTNITLDTARFQYLPADDRSNGSVMVFMGSPTYRRKIIEQTRVAQLERIIPTKEKKPNLAVQVLRKEDEVEFAPFIRKVAEGLKEFSPEMCEEGLNGTYFMKDKQGNMIAVFKPQDEEGNSENNPKKLEEGEEEFVDKGVLEGEAAQREVAAYLLDKESGFAGVPKTTMVKIIHPSFGRDTKGEPLIKIGSLQEFVQNDGASWDIGYGAFPTHEVQKIAIFDLRIFNNDRHGGNMLMKKKSNGTYELIPIDHGFSLSSVMNRAWFDWLNWPQAKEPLSTALKDYVSKIDVEKDIETLKPLNIRPECLRTMKISTMLLKKGCELGLSLFDIASIVCRPTLEQPSELEMMYERALKDIGQVNGEIVTKQEEQELLGALSRIMDEELLCKDKKNAHCT